MSEILRNSLKLNHKQTLIPPPAIISADSLIEWLEKIERRRPGIAQLLAVQLEYAAEINAIGEVD